MHVAHRHEQHVGVRQIEHVLGARRHARRVLRALHVDARDGQTLRGDADGVAHASRDDVPLLGGERRVAVLRENLLRRALLQAVRQRFRVPRRRGFERQRPGVGVNAQTEKRRVLLGDGHVFLLQHLRHNRRRRADPLDDELRGVYVRRGKNVVVQHNHLFRDVQPGSAVREPVATLRVHHPDPAKRVRRERALLADGELVLVQLHVVRDAGRRASREHDERAVGAQPVVPQLRQTDRAGQRVEVRADVRQHHAQGRQIGGGRGGRSGDVPVVGRRRVVEILVVVAVVSVPGSAQAEFGGGATRGAGRASTPRAADARDRSIVRRGLRARPATSGPRRSPPADESVPPRARARRGERGSRKRALHARRLPCAARARTAGILRGATWCARPARSERLPFSLVRFFASSVEKFAVPRGESGAMNRS